MLRHARLRYLWVGVTFTVLGLIYLSLLLIVEAVEWLTGRVRWRAGSARTNETRSRYA